MGGKGGGGSAPSPDPQIGQAALEQAQLGRDYLAFAKDSYADSMLRQQDMDALTKRVVEQQMGIADSQLGISQKQAALAEEAARQQMGIVGRQAELAEQVTGKQLAMSDKQLEIANQQQQWATADRNRYENVFLPIEDQFIDEATNYASPERQAQAAAEARADVQRSADVARAQSQRQMASMGVNPNSGRFAGVDRAAEIETALATAGAQNQARTQVRDKGLALKADVANMGRGLPAQSAQATSLGLGAGQASAGTAGAAVGTSGAAVGSLQGLGAGYSPAVGSLSAAGSSLGSALGAMGASNANFLNSQGIMGQGYGMAMQGVGSQANILNQQYQNQLNAWSANQQASAQNSAGIFGAVGTGLGLAFSSKKLKENRKPAKDGLKAVNSMPIEEYKYKKGVADEGEHVGPMAEDFQKATGKGDGTTIALQDAIGVTMKAVQELDEKVENMAASMPGLGGRKKPVENRRAA